jgi:methylglutaconyl-CoA hydratase
MKESTLTDTPELLHYAVDAGVATLTIDSPANRNALSRPLMDSLLEKLQKALDDDAVRVIVLAATGTVFCSGVDLKDVPGPGQLSMPGMIGEVIKLLYGAAKPTIAKIQGHIRAGGIGIASACDIVVAVDRATFAFSEVRIGVTPSVISVSVLPRIGITRAHELYLTGEPFDAAAAERYGLVNKVVAPDEIDAAVTAYCESIRKGGPNALAAIKEMLRQAPFASPEEGVLWTLGFTDRIFASPEGREGISSFFEKRPPKWLE